jgi:hypothetical protein
LAKVIEMEGKKFGRLLVLEKMPHKPYELIKWLCVCECGKRVSVDGVSLRQGRTRSCGCIRKESQGKNLRTHGMTGTKTHRAWKSIMSRCYNKNVYCYKHYGGRGISVDKRWHKFENFYNDMGEPPTRKHEIDRIDNNGDYKKGNCRWVTRTKNAQNTRATKLSRKIVLKIRDMYDSGERICDIARTIGVRNWNTVDRAAKRQTWKNV